MFRYILFIFMLTTMISHESMAQTIEQKEVAASVEMLRKAMIDADSSMLSKIADDSLTYGHSSGFVQHKPEFIHSFTSGASDFITIDLSDQTIQLFGNTAIVRHILSAQTNDNGKPGTVKLKILTVWQKENGDWKLIARQAVRANE